MRKKIFSLLLTATMLFSMPFSVFAENEIIVETAPVSSETNNIDETSSDVTKLSSSIRAADQEDVIEWANKASIINGATSDSLKEKCTWKQFLTLLWKTNGAPTTATAELMENETEKEQENVYQWAVNAGLLSKDTGKQQLLYTMMFGNAEWALWYLAGEPAPSSSSHNLPIGDHEDAELWSCDIGLITKEEQPNANPSAEMTYGDALNEVYYLYNRRSESSFPITVDQFLLSCQRTVDYARTHNYIYGSSSAQNPTTDGIISCDRLVAKALYDLGYTDQPRGGVVCSNIDHYLNAWGFERSTSLADAKRGSIMLVKHRGKDHTSHVFVLASDFNLQTMRGDRYDCGSNGFIRSQQPIRNLGFWYRTDDVIVYNIPS